MKYRVHRLKVSRNDFQSELAEYINSLQGEVISVIPNITSNLLRYGARVDYVLIIEKTIEMEQSWRRRVI